MAIDDTSAKSNNLIHLPYADAATGVRHVFVRDYLTDAEIGVWSYEKGASQKIRISVDLSVSESAKHHEDQLENVVCYNEIVIGIKKIIAAGHIQLVETLAEKIATMTLENLQVIKARVKVEKLEAVPEAASVGVEIERRR